MGSVRFGVPEQLLLQLKEKFSINAFVETGTERGFSAAWAAKHFEKVWTVEASPALFDEAQKLHGTHSNINFLLGTSIQVLPSVLAAIREPAIFWLDSHFCHGLTYGQEDQCPLLSELEMIRQSQYQHFILIDDAVLFLSTPPKHYKADDYPRIDRIIAELQNYGYSMHISIIEDVIVAVPSHASSVIELYSQDVNTQAFARRIYQDAHRIEYGGSLIAQGLNVIGQELRAKIGRVRRRLSDSATPSLAGK